MDKKEIISNWEERYDSFLQVADENQAKLAELDMINDWEKYKKVRNIMEKNYYICSIISQFLKDLEEING